MAPSRRLQTLRIAASSVAPIAHTAIGAPCVLALLGFRAPARHPGSRRDH
ncbi:MAG: hypothetical protein ACRDL7_00825 [Gaiellaceae bacterium]